MQSYESLVINQKLVYIVEKHHWVLRPWACIRNDLRTKLNLITLDLHTDYILGLVGLIYEQKEKHHWDNERAEVELNQIRKGTFNENAVYNQSFLVELIEKLKHDEHIETAIQIGILDKAFLIIGRETNEALSGELPKDKVFVVGAGEVREINPEWENYRDLTIDSKFLAPMLSTLARKAKVDSIENLLSSDYILDIDLDYFATSNAISPQDPDIFYEMIRKAAAITIALEPEFVNMNSLDSNDLLDLLLDHIENATGNNL